MMDAFDSKSVREAAILTTSYVAGDVFRMDRNINQINLYVDFTKGSLTSAEVKVEFSNDNSTWIQETFSSISGGVDTLTLGSHTFTATGGYRINVPTKDTYCRVSIKGTGTVTSSSATINAILGTV